jgi:hypothetical protein
MTEQLFVKSHVARDLLQSAALFKTDKLVVWEYVSNGLQYVDSGVNPRVVVKLDNKNKRITIADNGRGMDWAGLHNFFVMHGENQDRRDGRAGRGRFGTGKSAAFGIADCLQITTIRSGKRSKVELHRDEVERMTSEDPIPVHIHEKEITTQEQNGTLIEISGIHLKSLDQPGIIHYIERHLARWNKNVTVFVNHHECEFAEPPIAEEFSFNAEGEFKEKLGNVNLMLKVSKKPLEDDLRGVSIFSKGVWYETTLAGSENKEMSQWIFGEIDVPRLDEDRSPIPPFDMSRSMRLNEGNELVCYIYTFIHQKVEEVRRKLVDAEKRRKSEEEEKKLAKQANEIAQIINEDFDAFRQKVAKVRAKASGNVDWNQVSEISDEQNDNNELLFGSTVPAEIVSLIGGVGSIGGTGGDGTEPRELLPQVEPSATSTEKIGDPASEKQTKSKTRGGFQVQFRNMGENEYRAQYVRDERTIYINLDHPQVATAKGKRPTDDPVFKRLAYEVAFSEYAVALASEFAARDEYNDPFDPIFDIRDTLNRVAQRAAALYAE